MQRRAERLVRYAKVHRIRLKRHARPAQLRFRLRSRRRRPATVARALLRAWLLTRYGQLSNPDLPF